MAQRILWDKYETALLIDTFWKIENNPEARQELIKRLSEDLRKKAVNAGLDIAWINEPFFPREERRGNLA